MYSVRCTVYSVHFTVYSVYELYVYVCIHIFMCMCVCTYVCMCLCAYACVFVFITDFVSVLLVYIFESVYTCVVCAVTCLVMLVWCVVCSVWCVVCGHIVGLPLSYLFYLFLLNKKENLTIILR